MGIWLNMYVLFIIINIQTSYHDKELASRGRGGGTDSFCKIGHGQPLVFTGKFTCFHGSSKTVHSNSIVTFQ